MICASQSISRSLFYLLEIWNQFSDAVRPDDFGLDRILALKLDSWSRETVSGLLVVPSLMKAKLWNLGKTINLKN